MGVRIVTFSLAFNSLLWLSRLTLGPWLASRSGQGLGFAATLVAPLALLALTARLVPSRRAALVAVAAGSLGFASLAAGG